MKLNSLNSAYSLSNVLYGTNIDVSNFEDIAIVAWEQLPNRHTRLYRYKTNTENKRIILPCNAFSIESVTIGIQDASMTSNLAIYPDTTNVYIESYIEGLKRHQDPLYSKGRYLKYEQEGDELVFIKDYSNVNILYKGIMLDDDGLPLINDKEIYAIALYLAYIDTFKKGLILKDTALVQLSSVLKNDWIKANRAASMPYHISQNEMDEILNASTRWDRKSYNRSYKPIL